MKTKKITSWILLLAYMQTQLMFANASPHQPINLSHISNGLSAVAFIDEVYQSQDAAHPFILHIRDLHCQYDAQLKTSDIIQRFSKNLNSQDSLLVLVEGADGLVDTNPFSSFPDQEVRTQAAHKLLESGRITGPEYLSIMNNLNIEIIGIEDAELYKQNFNAYRSVMFNESTIEYFFLEVTSLLNLLKENVLSNDLLDFLSKANNYKYSKLSFTNYFIYLHELNVGISNYPNLNHFAEIIKYQMKMSFKEIEIEKDIAFKRLMKTLPKEDLASLISINLRYRTESMDQDGFNKVFFQLINDHLSFKEFPQLAQFKKIKEAQFKIKYNVLMSEFNKYEYVARHELIQTEEEMKLLELLDYFEGLEKLLKFQISREDLLEINKSVKSLNRSIEELKDLAESHQVGIPNSFLDSNSKIIQWINKANQFYELALMRDRVMSKKAYQIIVKKKAKAAVIITGGFHTKGLTAFFKEKDLSYMVLTPLGSDSPNISNYKNIILDERLSVQTLAMYSIFNRISNLFNPELRFEVLDDLADDILYLAEQRDIDPAILEQWFSEWMNSGIRDAHLEKFLRERLFENDQHGEISSRMDLQSHFYDGYTKTLDLTSEIFQEMGNIPNSITIEGPTSEITETQVEFDSEFDLLERLESLPTGEFAETSDYRDFFRKVPSWNLLRQWIEEGKLTDPDMILTLDAQRAAIVNDMIHRAKEKVAAELGKEIDIENQVVGSTRPILSDYDVTIIGEYGVRVAKSFYEVWYETFEHISPIDLFDTNIYSPDVVFYFNFNDQIERTGLHESLKREYLMTYLSFLSELGSIQDESWKRLKKTRLAFAWTMGWDEFVRTREMFQEIEDKYLLYKRMLEDEIRRTSPNYDNLSKTDKKRLFEIARDGVLLRAYKKFIEFKENIANESKDEGISLVDKIRLIDYAMQISFYERDKYVALGSVQDIVYNQQKAGGQKDHQAYVDLTRGANFSRLFHSFLENFGKYIMKQKNDDVVYGLIHVSKYMKRMIKVVDKIDIKINGLREITEFALLLRENEGKTEQVNILLLEWAKDHDVVLETSEQVAKHILALANKEIWKLDKVMLDRMAYPPQIRLNQDMKSDTVEIEKSLDVNPVDVWDFMTVTGKDFGEAQHIVDSVREHGSFDDVLNLTLIPEAGNTLSESLVLMPLDPMFTSQIPGNNTGLNFDGSADLFDERIFVDPSGYMRVNAIMDENDSENTGFVDIKWAS